MSTLASRWNELARNVLYLSIAVVSFLPAEDIVSFFTVLNFIILIVVVGR